MKKFFLAMLLLFAMQHVMATTYYTVADGEWEDNIWSSVCSTCTGGALPTLVNGDILIIDDQVTISSITVTTSASVTIYLRTDDSPETTTAPAKLIFSNGGKLSLGAGSSITLQNQSTSSADPVIDGSGSGGSNTITVGGSEYWRASDGDRQGTGTLQPDGTLPVILIYIQVNKTEEGVLVSWATSMEENLSEFVIEHSSDGKKFAVAGTVPGAGYDINNIQTEYMFTHQHPIIGYNYYRLKAIDVDGSWETFKTVVLKLEGDKDVVVTPNPANADNLKFQTNFLPGDDDQIAIMNLEGQVLFTSHPAAGFNSILLHNELASGPYLLIYRGVEGSRVCRFVVK